MNNRLDMKSRNPSLSRVVKVNREPGYENGQLLKTETLRIEYGGLNSVSKWVGIFSCDLRSYFAVSVIWRQLKVLFIFVFQSCLVQGLASRNSR